MRVSALYQSNFFSSGLQLFASFVVSTLIAILIFACNSIAMSEISKEEQRANSINKILMCPVCPGESIDQSQNDLAINMKEIVKQHIAGGKTDDQILDYFVQKYGVVVLMEPPREGLGILVWTVPLAAFGVAVISVLSSLYLMRRRGKGEAEATELSEGPTGNEKAFLATVVEDAYEDENIQ